MRLPIFFSGYMLLASTHGQQHVQEVPLTLHGKLIFVDIRLDDDPTPLHLMFDSGAGVTVLDSAVARRRGLEDSGTQRIGTSGKPVMAGSSPDHTVHFGDGFTLDSVMLYLMDLSHLSAYCNAPVDGIIGADLYAKAVVCTDLDALRMRLSPPENYMHPTSDNAVVAKALDSGTFGLYLRMVPEGRKDTIELVVKIDTGAENHLTFYNPAVQAHGLMRPGKRHKRVSGYGVEATVVHNRRGRLPYVAVGQHSWRTVPAVYQVDPVHMLTKVVCDGLIGQSLLNDFNLTYHLSEGLLYLDPRRTR